MSTKKEFAEAGSTSMREYHGIAATDKENNSRELYVYCEELLPFMNGKIQATNADSGYKISDGKTKSSGIVTTTNAIKCVYRDESNSYSAYPPYVRRGEQVKIYNVGDTDQWYWSSAGRNDGARRTDKWRQQISDTLENNADLNDENSYHIDMDTRENQCIEISTCMANGEKYSYTFLIDAKNSKVMLSDNIANSLLIESEIPKITLKNSDNSMIELNGKNITIACEGNLNFTSQGTGAAGNMVMNTNGNIEIKNTGDIKLKSDGHMEVKVQEGIDVYAEKNISFLSGSLISLTAPSIALNKGTWKYK